MNLTYIKVNRKKRKITQNIIRSNTFAFLGDNIRFGGTGKFFNSKNISIEDNVYLGRDFYIEAISNVRICSGTMMGPKVTIIAGSHNYNSDDLKAIPYDKRIVDTPVIIGRNVWIGANVTICPGAVIEEGAVIGMGTVVSGRVERNTVVVSSKQIVINKRNEDIYNHLKDNNKLYNLICTLGEFQICKREEFFLHRQ